MTVSGPTLPHATEQLLALEYTDFTERMQHLFSYFCQFRYIICSNGFNRHINGLPNLCPGVGLRLPPGSGGGGLDGGG